MDPLTAALNVAGKALDLWKFYLESLPADKRQEAATWIHEDMKEWRAFVQLFKVKES